MNNFTAFIFLGVIVALFVVQTTFFNDGRKNMPYIWPVPTAFQEKKPPEKPFAYYTQTATCLPKDLLLPSVLGNGSFLDFYVLSFKNSCQPINQHSHVFYIFQASATWTQGRNALYRHVRKLGRQYKYHIFLDDDARLILTEDLINFEKKYNLPEATVQFNNEFFSKADGFQTLSRPVLERSAWRIVEQQLLKHSPAYANVAYCSRRSGVQGRIDQRANMKKMCGISPLPEVTVMFAYDALFIAFHDKALDMLFPMYEGYEKHSWWISDQIQFHTARILLRGSGITIWKASIFNLAHASYPRGGKMDWKMWEEFFKKDGKLINELSRPHKSIVESLDDNHLFSDVSLCGKHIKFPTHEHYANIYGV